MSRTDKDRPAWVVNHEIGLIDHDHRTGVCDVETLPYAQAFHGGAWRRWSHTCSKRTLVEYTCSRTDPHHDTWRDRRTCWYGAYVRVDRADGTWGLEFVWTACVGHRRVEHHPDTPCVCDTWPTAPTCTPAWSFGSYAASSSVPKWCRDHLWNNAERRRERDDLRALTKAANARGSLSDLVDDEDDWDFANHQHRHNAHWACL